MNPPEKLPHLRLKRERLKRVLSGHPWVFSNEIQEIPPLAPGSLVAVDDHTGKALGTGYFNPKTLIAVRWLMRGDKELPEDWLETRLRSAVERRADLYPEEGCARLVFGEADGLPGFIADRYGDAVVIQVLTAGAERLRDRFEACIRGLIDPSVIVRKDDGPMRELEGLPLLVESVPEEAEPTRRVCYLGLTLEVPLAQGQKTGLFLDQRENVRAFLGFLKPGARVLDVFSYLGVWGISALKRGAASAQFVDGSRPACELAEKNLALNGLPDSEIHNGDAFDVLSALRRGGEGFDAVICDPPAFAKSKKHLAEALKAYRRLNELAVSLVKPGGLLVTCSCSHHVTREEFREVLREAVVRSRREAVLLESRGQAPDHPVLLNFPEGEYLKAIFLALN